MRTGVVILLFVCRVYPPVRRSHGRPFHRDLLLLRFPSCVCSSPCRTMHDLEICPSGGLKSTRFDMHAAYATHADGTFATHTAHATRAARGENGRHHQARIFKKGMTPQHFMHPWTKAPKAQYKWPEGVKVWQK